MLWAGISENLGCCLLAVDKPLLWVLTSHSGYWCGALRAARLKGGGMAI